MPTYEADIEWLKVHHPGEYARIPQEKLTDPDYSQQHMSFHPDGPEGPEFWVIGFFPKDSADPELGDCFVELGLERPAAESPEYAKCPRHTLAVSRSLCRLCRECGPG